LGGGVNPHLYKLHGIAFIVVLCSQYRYSL